MNAFATLIGQYNSTLLTLTDGMYGHVALDSKSRVLISHGTSSLQIGNGSEVTPKYLSMLEEDTAAAGGEIGLGLIAVRQDTLGSLVGADGDYSMLSVDVNGALYVRNQSEHVHGSAATLATDLGQGALFVRKDTAGALTGVDDGDYAFGQVDAEGWIRMVPKGMQVNGAVATLATDIGMPFVGVRKDAEGPLTGVADGDYTFAQFDAQGRLKTTAEVDLTPGTEGDVCADEANAADGDISAVGLAAWVDVVSIALVSGTYLCTAIDGSADKLSQFRLVTWDASQDPGAEVTKLHRKFIVTENNGTIQLVFPRPIEVAGAADISVKLQAKRLRAGSTNAIVHGGINGYTL